MLTMAADSPTSTTAVLQSPTCSSPDGLCSVSNEQREEGGSPKSPKNDSLCQRRASNKARQRHSPYETSVRSTSPAGSCSSDGDLDSNEGDAEIELGLPGFPKIKYIKRVAANSRERKRMHTVNSAFDQLRELVPTYPSNRKLSKIDTLRLACTYIQDLVSLLHNSQNLQAGDDVLYNHPFPDSFSCYPPVSIKSELDYSAYGQAGQYRMAPPCLTPDCTESFPSSASESDSNHSPPQFIQQSCSQGIAARPPPLSRATSDGSVTIQTRMAHASISAHAAINTPPVYPQNQRQMNITSPLAMHSVQHSTNNTPLLSNGLVHPPTPVWTRTASVPTNYPLYGQ